MSVFIKNYIYLDVDIDSSVQNNINVMRKPNIDKFGRAYATGRRKTSVARVWIKKGNGTITINDEPMSGYFALNQHKATVLESLYTVNAVDTFDVICTVKGGGLNGQACAIRHGISRALDNYNPEMYHLILKRDGLLTRDDRMVESKRYGRKKSRKRFQFSKR
jgi:small subunit ribosomal protein S9